MNHHSVRRHKERSGKRGIEVMSPANTVMTEMVTAHEQTSNGGKSQVRHAPGIEPGMATFTCGERLYGEAYPRPVNAHRRFVCVRVSLYCASERG